MINTLNIKIEQLKTGLFRTGSGPETILILGSCRAVPYLNYLEQLNQHYHRYTLYFIDPFNWNWDENDNRVDYDKTLEGLETNQTLLGILSSVNIFIHEYYQNAGMFNVFPGSKNIYQFGMKPKIDISIPNFNDIFILFRDILSFDIDLRKRAIQDYYVIGKLSEEVIQEVNHVSQRNLDKFYDTCLKTDFPEFVDIFKSEFKSKRYFHTSNHVSKAYTLKVFELMNNKFLKISILQALQTQISQHDMYDSHFTKLCEYDQGYSWPEPVSQLKEIL